MPTILQPNKTLLNQGILGYPPVTPASGIGLQIIGADGTRILDTKYAPQALTGVLYFLGESTMTPNNLYTPSASWTALTGTTVNFTLSRTATVLIVGQITDDMGPAEIRRTAGVAGQSILGYSDTFGFAGLWWSPSFLNHYTLAAGSYTASIYIILAAGGTTAFNIHEAVCSVYRWGA